jgi:hypothetical protein
MQMPVAFHHEPGRERAKPFFRHDCRFKLPERFRGSDHVAVHQDNDTTSGPGETGIVAACKAQISPRFDHLHLRVTRRNRANAVVS